MPVVPTYPGVYIEEVSSGVRTITGVATSIAAFFGRTSKGPMNRATRLLSPSDYVRQFGAPHPHSDLATSVMQFFMNGGTDCYVIRLAKGARKAKVTLKSLRSENILIAEAKAEGAWANTVRLEVDYNTVNPDAAFNLRVIQEEGGAVVASESFTGLSMNPTSPRFAPTFVTQGSGLIDLNLHPDMYTPDPAGTLSPGSYINLIANSFAGFSLGLRPLGASDADVRTTLNNLIAPAGSQVPQAAFEISVNGAPPVTVDLRPWTIAATATIVDIQTAIQDKINAAIGPLNTVTCTLVDVTDVGRLLTITANSGGNASVEVRRVGANDITAALMLGVDQGGIEAPRWSNFRPAPTATFVRLGAGTTPGDLATVKAIMALTQDAITAIAIDGASPIPLSLVTVPPGGTNRWHRNAPVVGNPNGNNDGVREKLRIIANTINSQVSLPWRAEVWGYHLAFLAKAGKGVSPSLQPATIATTPASNPIFDLSLATTGWTNNVRQYSLGTSTGSFSTATPGTDDGNDGAAPDLATYLGNPLDKTGLYALDKIDLFNLMIIPGDDEVPEVTYTNLWGPASTYCREHRAFLLVDAPASWTKNELSVVKGDPSLVQNLRSLLVQDHAAIFYPRLKYNANGLVKFIGPAGAIAGLMSRTDSSRGVWKAAAGLEANILGIVGLEVNLTDPENGVLNKLGVDCLRSFPSGFVNWGARTATGFDDNPIAEWKYIPIRRLALFLEESLYRGTKWVVFEPNDEPLWAKIRLNLRAFMNGLFRQGAFQGSTPDQAFYVKCDNETTTQADRNLGIVNIEVGFAPLKPAEFVIIKIQQMPGDL